MDLLPGGTTITQILSSDNIVASVYNTPNSNIIALIGILRQHHNNALTQDSTLTINVTGGPPIILGINGQSQLVTGLNADLLNGHHFIQFGNILDNDTNYVYLKNGSSIIASIVPSYSTNSNNLGGAPASNYRCVSGCNWTCTGNCSLNCITGCTGCTSCTGSCTGCSSCSGCTSCTGNCGGGCKGVF